MRLASNTACKRLTHDAQYAIPDVSTYISILISVFIIPHKIFLSSSNFLEKTRKAFSQANESREEGSHPGMAVRLGMQYIRSRAYNSVLTWHLPVYAARDGGVVRRKEGVMFTASCAYH